MVHELLGINNNRVSLAGVPGVAKDLQVGKRGINNNRVSLAGVPGVAKDLQVENRGINNNRVSLAGVPGVAKDLQVENRDLTTSIESVKTRWREIKRACQPNFLFLIFCRTLCCPGRRMNSTLPISTPTLGRSARPSRR